MRQAVKERERLHTALQRLSKGKHKLFFFFSDFTHDAPIHTNKVFCDFYTICELKLFYEGYGGFM